MPRILLTDEEAKVIETFRQKNAARDAFNRGLDAARTAVREYHEPGLSPTLKQTLDEAIQDMRQV